VKIRTTNRPSRGWPVIDRLNRIRLALRRTGATAWG